MGFTPNGIRLVGPEPLNPVLLYNLGCNGVGLMPSIFGGRKIARFLAGEVLPPSMFDPVDQRVSEARPSILLRGVQDRSSGAAR
jgi:glycine/D-amino acid oxidase-like deaminating enzyme